MKRPDYMTISYPTTVFYKFNIKNLFFKNYYNNSRVVSIKILKIKDRHKNRGSLSEPLVSVQKLNV